VACPAAKNFHHKTIKNKVISEITNVAPILDKLSILLLLKVAIERVHFDEHHDGGCDATRRKSQGRSTSGSAFAPTVSIPAEEIPYSYPSSPSYTPQRNPTYGHFQKPHKTRSYQQVAIWC
jgi:hypothetical protein